MVAIARLLTAHQITSGILIGIFIPNFPVLSTASLAGLCCRSYFSESVHNARQVSATLLIPILIVRLPHTLCLVLLLSLCANSILCAQSTANAGRALEDLNLKGGAADNPPFTDTIFGTNSPIRTELFRHGVLFRMSSATDYIQNTLAAPVADADQNYIGQRQYFDFWTNPVLTADLRQLGLHKAQLNINGQVQISTWDPAMPFAVTSSNLYVYKEFGEDRVEMKFGYLTTDFQFIGLQVGGQVTSGAQGVYAVLPYEVGISHSPMPSPAVTLKYRWDTGLYVKGAAQRSLEPGGLQAALHRDAVGVRFLQHGDKLVLIGEAGLKRAAARNGDKAQLERWIRLGYIDNNTPYTSLHTGLAKSGNYCAYLLADHQLWQSDAAKAFRGIYGGASAMVVPADLNTYRLYYEARVYSPAPFSSRPGDFASVVASFTGISQDTIHALIAAGKSYSRSSDSLTGSYTARLARGTYLSLGLSYVNGPSVTPKVPAALTFTATTSVYF